MHNITIPFLEVKADDQVPGSFSGYGSTFGNVDLGKDICSKGCFSRSLSEGEAKGVMPAMYWMHDRSLPIGDFTSMREDAKGLMVTGKLWIGKGIPEAERAYCMLQGTGPKGLSIGYIAKKSTYDEKKGTRTLDDVDLMEVSVVGYGMNPKALVTSIKSTISDGNVPTIRDLEEVMRDAGLSKKQAMALLSSGYKAIAWDGHAEEVKDDGAELLKELHRIIKPTLA